MPFPEIDPIIFEIGPLAIRWYSLAYIVGLVGGWMYMKRLAVRKPAVCDGDAVDDFLFWATIGVVLGGRLGIVLFYQFDYYMTNPVVSRRVLGRCGRRILVHAKTRDRPVEVRRFIGVRGTDWIILWSDCEFYQFRIMGPDN